MPTLYSNLEEIIAHNSITAVIIASAILAILTTLSLLLKKPNNSLKKILFISFCLVTIGTTLFLAGSTLYLNNISYSKGPVHYHADFEIWNCNQEVNLKYPKGWSNKIGTATLHEHNDKRIHLEGVVVGKDDQSLGKFFQVIGGKIDHSNLVVPTNERILSLTSGSNCPNGEKAVLQVFVYKVFGKQMVQTKVADPESYIYSPHSGIPPGDCIIVEFSKETDKTNKLCRSFQVAKQLGKIQ